MIEVIIEIMFWASENMDKSMNDDTQVISELNTFIIILLTYIT
jgi:hypothetical protein